MSRPNYIDAWAGLHRSEVYCRCKAIHSRASLHVRDQVPASIFDALAFFGDSVEADQHSVLIAITVPDGSDQSSERSDAGRRSLQKVIGIVKREDCCC